MKLFDHPAPPLAAKAFFGEIPATANHCRGGEHNNEPDSADEEPPMKWVFGLASGSRSLRLILNDYRHGFCGSYVRVAQTCPGSTL